MATTRYGRYIVIRAASGGQLTLADVRQLVAEADNNDYADDATLRCDYYGPEVMPLRVTNLILADRGE